MKKVQVLQFHREPRTFWAALNQFLADLDADDVIDIRDYKEGTDSSDSSAIIIFKTEM